jgi:2-desacetyl-2-hydroxyethyl bacteriochlorophyllide A dehydrogenase
MKAAVVTGYGPPEVIEIRDVPNPVPGAGEVLVKVRASTVVAGDVRIRASDYSRFAPAMRVFLGLRRPRRSIPGNEFSGVVVAVGDDVTRLRIGEPVFGVVWGIAFAGANAEYLCVPEDGMIATRPDSLSDAEAAALPVGGLCALHFLRRAGIRPGQQVLIVGGAGSVGTYAIQLARHYGAHVTAVCGPASVDLVRSLGAERVIDYSQEEFTATGETYDVVFDAAMKTSLVEVEPILKAGAVYLTLDWPILELVKSWFMRDKKMVIGMASKNRDDLLLLRQLAADGELKPVIDRCYPLEEIREAHRYVDTGHKHGNLAVTVGDD